MSRPPVGSPRYAALNARLNSLLAQRSRPLICVHRGTSRGSIPENTTAAVQLAVRHGADLVEIDLARSSDGIVYVFHTGYEPMAFGIDERLDSLSSKEIDALRYRWFDATGSTPVTRFADLVGQTDVLLNIDRSWWYWPAVLDDLAALRATDRLLLKSTPGDDVAALAAHPEKFPYLAMVQTPDQVEELCLVAGLNLVGFELHADGPDHPFTNPRFVKALRDRGFLIWVTALTLGHRRPQFAGWDDEVSVLGDPDAGWGRLLALDPDVVHTDWPTLLRRYLATRR